MAEHEEFKKFDGLLKREIDAWPTESYDIPQHFSSIERAFEDNDVPERLYVKLLRQHLTHKIRRILASWPNEAVASYADIKQHLLVHYSLTSARYRELYESASKKSKETFVQLKARLCLLLKYYTDSRKVHDFGTLFALFISDKIKSCMHKTILDRVNDLGTK